VGHVEALVSLEKSSSFLRVSLPERPTGIDHQSLGKAGYLAFFIGKSASNGIPRLPKAGGGGHFAHRPDSKSNPHLLAVDLKRLGL
jgi:hypothetical protein